ncbi:DUF1822 family protein [Aetokthonos hydrillicola Thurmond2011]|jgi:hypothetical protein|uniref:DUF1822 family protein n=1 Tax=Aetokthonos hydrillicola Thurmond2011 TaxID=2712845 RepID=A0AAP5I5X1_9CYAN|nr:DUF1822 family protein [Aetokthonos hydrillicola]MBO3458530.1 DUF1822 family protein [Aetokthonos hydrillicola CCALA 1050]MBW4584974.1 DUF1822 family protein [Aetokthonos hydrillicola CCALA 1050]MDR9894267.1 DUF1822 family protein [Aetokthonos hydrillicola Thurmond2011]
MLSQPPPTDFSDLIDWRSLNESRTELLPQHFKQAARLSKLIYTPQQRWQVYLCSLAVLGFKEWLKERAPDLVVEIDSASIWKPAYANLMAAASNIRVGNFKICLITSDDFADEQSIPFAALDIPDLTAHFYVLMQVEEEQQQVGVFGFMNYEQYSQRAKQLQINPDWTYSLPSTWFNPDPENLLLNLRCLQPDAIRLPKAIPRVDNNMVELMQKKLTTLASQLKSQSPWDLLTVREGAILLSNSDLVNLAYKNIVPSTAKRLINVGFSLNNRLDELAQELGWVFMPSPLVSAMRSQQDEFGYIRSGLEQQGIYIPKIARGAFRNLNAGRIGLRLYVITWVLSESTQIREWMLLVALGVQPDVEMPKTLRLQVRDKTEVLFDELLKNTKQGILYAQLIGDLGELFWVTVTADGSVFEIPPFGLELEGGI